MVHCCEPLKPHFGQRHRNGRTSRCVRSCVRRTATSRKALSQYAHVCWSEIIVLCARIECSTADFERSCSPRPCHTRLSIVSKQAQQVSTNGHRNRRCLLARCAVRDCLSPNFIKHMVHSNHWVPCSRVIVERNCPSQLDILPISIARDTSDWFGFRGRRSGRNLARSWLELARGCCISMLCTSLK